MKYVITAVVFVLLGFVASYMWLENPKAKYASYDDAVRAWVVGPDKWIPEFLPKSASQIVERHNIDTNESLLTFQFWELISRFRIPACIYRLRIPVRMRTTVNVAPNWAATGRLAAASCWSISKMYLSNAGQIRWSRKQRDAQLCVGAVREGSSERAAGARKECSPAARRPGFARPAQRGR